jgi:hypothetical protein
LTPELLTEENLVRASLGEAVSKGSSVTPAVRKSQASENPQIGEVGFLPEVGS